MPRSLRLPRRDGSSSPRSPIKLSSASSSTSELFGRIVLWRIGTDIELFPFPEAPWEAPFLAWSTDGQAIALVNAKPSGDSTVVARFFDGWSLTPELTYATTLQVPYLFWQPVSTN